MGRLAPAILVVAVLTQASPATVRDTRDGAVYPVIRIGSLDWFARNLAFAATPSWCYGDRADGCVAHGRLYTWTTARTACPAGWRLASDEDWMNLENALGMRADELRNERARGTDQGARLRAGGATGFEALISGYRRPEGDYVRRGERTAYWTATEANVDDAWHRDIRPDVDTIYRSPVTKTYALSVRCVR
ncbi:MAG TPA: FISUMP domain-containing protein [Vicinamibacterales bacterium]|nr:FISUMP domain-containing protein [Vicinamibacterales bacterium]